MKKTVLNSTTFWADWRLWLVFAALGALAVYSEMLWAFVLIALLLAYELWSYLWTFWGCRHLQADDPLEQTGLFAKDTLRLTWHFKNAWHFTLARCGLRLFLPDAFACSAADGICITEKAPQDTISERDVLRPAWKVITAQWPWLGAGAQRFVEIELNAPLRGCYYLPPARAFSGDPSGLYEGFCQTGRAHFLNVFPAIKGEAELARSLSFDKNMLADLLGFEDPYQAVGTRDYETGDSPKSINWYATARTASVKSNFYQRQNAASCIVALDLSCGFVPVVEPDEPRREDPPLEDAISLACGIALAQLSRGVKTAFVTNAPTLSWDRVTTKMPPGDFGVRLKRSRTLTALAAGLGTEHERHILELCAHIDDTSRATCAGQQKLWEHLLNIPPQTAVYLLCYHTMPKAWVRLKASAETGEAVEDPAAFYTPGRLAGLPASVVRVMNLSGPDFSDSN